MGQLLKVDRRYCKFAEHAGNDRQSPAARMNVSERSVYTVRRIARDRPDLALAEKAESFEDLTRVIAEGFDGDASKPSRK